MVDLKARRITFVISSLQGGGAERVACMLSNAWNAVGVHVTILTMETRGASAAYPLSPGVEYQRLGLNRPVRNKLEAVHKYASSATSLRKAIRKSKPDVVVAFLGQTNVLTLAASLGLGFPVVISERCHPEYYDIGRGWEVLRRALYPRAEVLVVQTNEIAAWCRMRFNVSTHVIPNPVLASPADRKSRSAGRKVVVAGGRLDPQKGFDLLIEAFSALADEYPQWDVKVFGRGAERQRLQETIDSYGLADRIVLAGWTDDLAAHLREADIFALPSRFEGFPNVLCEAMAAGLSVVAFDCPSGPADIIRDGADGLLIPVGDVDRFRAGLEKLMADDDLRGKMGEKGKDVVQRFSLERNLALWAEVINTVLS